MSIDTTHEDSELKPSAACIALIKRFEGCRLTAYQDVIGRWTIGYGHAALSVREGDAITQTQAEAALCQDVDFTARAVYRLTGDIPQCQFDALCSWAFNLGVGALATSTLLRKLRAGDIRGSAEEFQHWDHAGGVQVLGLTRRRFAEYEMFLGGAPVAA